MKFRFLYTNKSYITSDMYILIFISILIPNSKSHVFSISIIILRQCRDFSSEHVRVQTILTKTNLFVISSLLNHRITNLAKVVNK